MNRTRLWHLPTVWALCLLLAVPAAASEAATEGLRPAWSSVEPPFIVSATEVAGGQIQVDILGVVGEAGGDELVVILYDKGGNALTQTAVTTEADRHTLYFSPEDTGSYSFQAELRRAQEVAKASATVSVAFGSPLGKPAILSTASVSCGSLQIQWTAVEEATGYMLLLDGESLGQVEVPSYTTTGLKVGQRYSLQVVALRGSERTVSDVQTFTVEDHIYQEECWDTGYHWRLCSCGDRGDYAAHTLQWVVDREATGQENGLRHQQCSSCGYKEAPVETVADQPQAEPPARQPSAGKGLGIAAVAAGVAAAAAVLCRRRRAGKKG